MLAATNECAPADGWRTDALLHPALMGAADWAAGCTGRVVDQPSGPVLRPDTVAEIAEFVRALGPVGTGGFPIEIELVGPPGSGRTTLAAQAAAELGKSLVAVDVAALAAEPDLVTAATPEVRRAELDGAVLAWEHAETMPTALWQQIPPTPLSFLSVPAQVAGAVD